MPAKPEPALSTSAADNRKPDVTVNGETMDAEGCAIRAIFDPGVFVERRRRAGWEEPLHRWQARAVVHAIDLAGHLDQQDGCRATPERWHD